VVDRAELQRWMLAAADGERAAIEPLFATLWPIVAGYATRLLGDRAIGEDCAQDALVRLFGQLRRTIAPATFRKRLERALARLRTSWRSRHGAH
jgi:DNA-directed RNA polymerase specialized sigma24 family protein